MQLRQSLLRTPLGLKIAAEEREAESCNRHFVWMVGCQLVATLMAVPLQGDVMQLRQMAVACDQQCKGVGSALLAAAETVLRGDGVRLLRLHARETAIGFYRRCGYQCVGDPFEELGIAHQRMEKTL